MLNIGYDGIHSMASETPDKKFYNVFVDGIIVYDDWWIFNQLSSIFLPKELLMKRHYSNWDSNKIRYEWLGLNIYLLFILLFYLEQLILTFEIDTISYKS